MSSPGEFHSGALAERGVDGNKAINGGSRHIVVDIWGNPIAVLVHATNLLNTNARWNVLEAVAEKCGRLKAFSGDRGYRGGAVEFVERALGSRLHTSREKQRCVCLLLIQGSSRKPFVGW